MKLRFIKSEFKNFAMQNLQKLFIIHFSLFTVKVRLHMKKDKKVVKLRKNNFFKNSIFIPFILLITALIILAFSPLFNIKEIKVKGNLRLTENSIVKESGIEIGQNILRLNKSSIKEALFNLPYIKDVSIRRNWPDTIIISLVEKNEIAKIVTFGATIALGEDGQVLEAYSDNSILDIPLIDNVEVFNYGVNMVLETSDNEKVNNLLEVLKIFEKNDMLQVVEKIDKNDGIIIYTKDGHIANLGDMTDLDYKIKRLKAVTKREVEEKYYFDISNLNIDTISKPLWTINKEKQDAEVVE